LLGLDPSCRFQPPFSVYGWLLTNCIYIWFYNLLMYKFKHNRCRKYSNVNSYFVITTGIVCLYEILFFIFAIYVHLSNPVVKGNNYKRLLQIQLPYDHGNENHKLCTQINVSVAIEYQVDSFILGSPYWTPMWYSSYIQR
jgi:hypothetical protein